MKTTYFFESVFFSSSYSGQLPLYSPQDFRLALDLESTDERNTELDREFVPCPELNSLKTKV